MVVYSFGTGWDLGVLANIYIYGLYISLINGQGHSTS